MSESIELTHQNPKTGTIRITQERLDQTDLVVLVDHDGFVEFSAIGRDEGQVVRMLRDIAKALENGTLDQSFRAQILTCPASSSEPFIRMILHTGRQPTYLAYIECRRVKTMVSQILLELL